MSQTPFRSLLETECRRSGLNLEREALDRLEGHYHLLVKWNHAVRLVGDDAPEVVLRRHLLQSLALLPFISEPQGSLLDIGSGNGFPAVTLKCVLGALRLCMLEPTLRKSQFLATAGRELGFKDCEVIRARVDHPQDLARHGRWDTITMRGVAAIPTVMKGAAAALRPGGRVLFMVGETGRAEILRHLAGTLELVTSQPMPDTESSYIVAVGVATSNSHDTVH